MSRHHRLGAGVDPDPKRRQLDAVEASPVVMDHRQAEMRIDVCIAVAREMLQRRQHAARREPLGIRAGQLAHPHRILTERPGIDHRVARVVVHIGHRGEVDMHPDGAGLGRGDPARLVR